MKSNSFAVVFATSYGFACLTTATKSTARKEANEANRNGATGTTHAVWPLAKWLRVEDKQNRKAEKQRRANA